MHFVDRERRRGRLPLRPPRHPVLVLPRKVERGDDRARARRRLRAEREGIGLVHAVAAMARDDVELVHGAGPDHRNEPFPDSRLRARTKREAALVPVVEVAHHEYALGVRREDREGTARPSPDFHGMRAQLLVEPEVAPLVEEVKVVVGQKTRVFRTSRRRPSRGRPPAARRRFLRDRAPPGSALSSRCLSVARATRGF